MDYMQSGQGMGTSGGALLGMILYGESKDWKRIVFITAVQMIGSSLIFNTLCCYNFPL